MRESIVKTSTFKPNYTGFVLPEPPRLRELFSNANFSNCCFIGYGLDCYGKFKELPHLCLINQIGLKYTQEDQSLTTPDKELSVVPRRTPSQTPNTQNSSLLCFSRNSEAHQLESQNQVLLFEQ